MVLDMAYLWVERVLAYLFGIVFSSVFEGICLLKKSNLYFLVFFLYVDVGIQILF